MLMHQRGAMPAGITRHARALNMELRPRHDSRHRLDAVWKWLHGTSAASCAPVLAPKADEAPQELTHTIEIQSKDGGLEHPLPNSSVVGMQQAQHAALMADATADQQFKASSAAPQMANACTGQEEMIGFNSELPGLLQAASAACPMTFWAQHEHVGCDDLVQKCLNRL